MGTLSQHRRRPALSQLDMRHLKVDQVMSNYSEVKKYLSHPERGGEQAHPEHDAISFYYLNTAYAHIGQRVQPEEPLGDYEALIEEYQNAVRVASLRLFFYLLLICTRESRHIQQNQALFVDLQSRYGAMIFTKQMRGFGPMDAAELFINKPPSCLMGDYTDHLVDVFELGSFSSGYGGQKWADIAKVLRNFTHGVLSPELMLDTGFTLAHNGGPIFNKEMLYRHYSKSELMRVLDAQRAGMVPQLVRNSASSMVTAKHKMLDTKVVKVLGSDFGVGPMDWALATKLGAKQKHTNATGGVKVHTPKTAAYLGSVNVSGLTMTDSVFINPKLAAKAADTKR